MRRFFLSILIVCGSLSLWAGDLPNDYYQAAEGQSDSILKQRLHETIRGGERYKYGSQSDQSVNLYTWNGFRLTDSRPDGTIWDMYSPYTHHFTYHDRGASGMAIEHSFPKSWWGWNTTKDETNFAYRDLFHLNPSEHRANGKKSDNMPGEIEGSASFDNGVFRVGKMHNGKTVFEPADCYKGDFARAYFYIVTCYADYTWLTTGPAADAMTNDSYKDFQPWLEDVLMAWHRLDPVSQKEIDRQRVIHDIQKNRNPYIDYPELAEYIWGNKQGEAVHFAALTYTGSNAYTPPLDTLNSISLPATEVQATRFTAHWQDAGKEDYTLSVFTQDTTGHPDTLINMPGLKSSWINAQEYMSWDGTNRTSDGDAGIILGNTSTDFHITITGLTIPENTTLVVRANSSKYESTAAQLLVTVDGVEHERIELTFSETYYRIPIPAGAKEIILSQGISKKRVSMQCLYLIKDIQEITRHSLPDFPITVGGTSHEVTLSQQPQAMLYYTITPANMPESNIVAVDCVHQVPTALPHIGQDICIQQTGSHITIHALPRGTHLQLFDTLGRLLWNRTANSTTFSFDLPQTGIFMLRLNGKTHKLSN